MILLLCSQNGSGFCESLVMAILVGCVQVLQFDLNAFLRGLSWPGPVRAGIGHKPGQFTAGLVHKVRSI